MNSAHDLDTWRLFFQVVNLGSVSKAAQSLHQETSAISRKLNKIGERFRYRIVHKGRS